MAPELNQAAVEPPVAVEPPARLRQFAAAWRGELPLPSEPAASAEVRAGNLVVEGVFRGIQKYVLRPVPATGESARRLRARSFRTAALGELLARRVAQRLGLTLLFDAGGTFLLAGPAPAGWEDALHSLQREFDIWLFQHLHPAGELQCHLAGALCRSEQLPREELEERQRQRRLQPLEGALRVGMRWNGRVFVLAAGLQVGRCSGCAAVAPVRLFGEETLCDGCAAESELGERLRSADRGWLCSEPEADLPGPGLGLRFSPPVDTAAQELRLDIEHWPLLRRIPAQDGRALDFPELAQHGGGTRLLGYLRVDVDHVRRAFAALEGDPVRTVGLSRLLRGFFGEHVQQLLESEFPLVYPVYGGGDDLLLIGPWQDALDLAVRLRQDFAALVGDPLTFSAGLTLAPSESSLRSAAELAAEQLRAAKEAGGDRLHALESLIHWKRAASLMATGKTLAEWLQRRAISAAWLNRLAELRASSANGDPRWRPRLHSAIRDPQVKHPAVRVWAARLANGDPGSGDGSDWPWMEFLAHYASLAGSS